MPYKGDASYFSHCRRRCSRSENTAWSYETPHDAVSALKIRAHVAFYPDRVDGIEEWPPGHRRRRTGAAAEAVLVFLGAGRKENSDRAQLQRGFKVYREVCQSCHSLSLISFRNLAEPGGPGFSTAQAAAVAAEYKVQDGPNDAGEMFERPRSSGGSFFRSRSANDNAARAANGGAPLPDLSLIARGADL